MTTSTKAGPTSDAASEEQLFPRSGSRPTVTVSLGGVQKTMVQLSARKVEGWKLRIGAEVAKRVGSIGPLEKPENLAKVFSGAQDVQIELLVAYDEEGRLGGADWILDNATPTEIWAAFKEVLYVAIPFLRDATRAPALVAELLPQLAALLSNSPSASGDEASTT